MNKLIFFTHKATYLVVFILITINTYFAQTTWSLKIQSRVEIRNFKLTSKAEITEESLPGASIMLYKGSSIISQVQSDGGGNFEIFAPADGEYVSP